MFYAYLLCNDRTDPNYRWSTDPICHIEVVKGSKDGIKRFEELCERHSAFLPPADDDGWHRITQRAIDAPNNAWIDKWKLEIQRRLAAVSIVRHGSRRLWARSVGAPSGWYRISYTDANAILTEMLNSSGLYVRGG